MLTAQDLGHDGIHSACSADDSEQLCQNSIPINTMLITEKIRCLSEMDSEQIHFRVAQELRIKRHQWQFAFDGKQLTVTK